MKPVIGILAPFLTPSQRAAIAAAAEENGFALREFATAEELEENCAECEVLYGYLSPSVLPKARALKWFQSASAGVDQFCDPALWQNPDAVLTNSSGVYGVTISEHMICLVLMLMRRIPEYMACAQRREWGPQMPLRSIYGSTIAVVGTGDLGTSFARRAKALGARCVRGVKRSPAPAGPCYDETYTSDRLKEAVADCDVVALCLPHTKETAGMIDASVLAAMAPRTLLVNVGRGSSVDQEALIEALNSGRLAGAALDVMVPEPLPKDHPLWSAKNLLITPHVAGNMSLGWTCEFDAQLFCENIARYRAGEPLKNTIDRTRGY